MELKAMKKFPMEIIRLCNLNVVRAGRGYYNKQEVKSFNEGLLWGAYYQSQNTAQPITKEELYIVIDWYRDFLRL